MARSIYQRVCLYLGTVSHDSLFTPVIPKTSTKTHHQVIDNDQFVYMFWRLISAAIGIAGPFIHHLHNNRWLLMGPIVICGVEIIQQIDSTAQVQDNDFFLAKEKRDLPHSFLPVILSGGWSWRQQTPAVVVHNAVFFTSRRDNSSWERNVSSVVPLDLGRLVIVFA